MLGGVLGWLAGSLLRIRRRHVEGAMTRAGIADAPAVATRMYRALGIALVELLRQRAALSIDDRDAQEALLRAVARGPVVLFASHTGNWELAAAAASRFLATKGRRLSIVAKPMSSRFVDRRLARLRDRLGVNVIAPVGALAAVLDALGRGDVVAMPIDQVPARESHGTWAPFLGAPALVDRAPATVAWRAGATALVIGATAGHVRVLAEIAPPAESDTARVWIEATALRATAALEAFVRAEPASWMWLHRRWRAPLVASVPAR